MTPRVAVLEVELPAAEVDVACGALWATDDVVAIEVQDRLDGRTLLRVGLRPDVAADCALGVLDGRWRVDLLTADADAWVEEARALAEVVHVGDRLVLVPPTREYRPKPTEIVIALDAGAAFGSGSHATTQLALAALERCVGPTDAVLDVGCGSGVLAVAAARLGASSVVAVDTDPNAVDATVANATANRMRDRITLFGSLREVDDAFGIIVANISAGVLVDLAPSIAALAADRGRLLLTGILDPLAAEVIDAYAGTGAELAGSTRRDGWTLVEWRARSQTVG